MDRSFKFDPFYPLSDAADVAEKSPMSTSVPSPIIGGLSISVEALSKSYTIGAPDNVTDILMDNHYLTLFGQHLVEELSTECLLALIEMQQFKGHLVEHCDAYTQDDDVEKTWYVLASGVPLSDIVYHEEGKDLKSYRRRARELYQKYIMVGSEFEVNIPAKMRRELRGICGDHNWIDNEEMTAAQVAMVFDGVMQEMRKLLKYSRLRFKSDRKKSSGA